MPTPDLRPEDIVDWNDARLDEAFRRADTLPLDRFVNAGEHRIDLGRREIYNDANWKGYLPKGLPLRDIAARLSTGYAKRFWKRKQQVLGETIYLNGSILLKHSLEEITIDKTTNDLDPGQYVLLRYTDPVFEHIFYDVMKAASPDLILYRGYSGRFPGGTRGWTAPLLRRYTFGQMGTADHAMLFAGGTMPTDDDLVGTWQLGVIENSNQLASVGRLRVDRPTEGHLRSACDPGTANEGPVLPGFVCEHFQGDIFSPLRDELRKVDDEYVVGRWSTDIHGAYAKLLVSGSPGLFHVERPRGGARRFTLYYVLRRTL